MAGNFFDDPKASANFNQRIKMKGYGITVYPQVFQIDFFGGEGVAGLNPVSRTVFHSKN
jgi:hypothetical protein